MTVIKQSYSSRLVTVRLGLLAAGLFVVATNAFVIAGLLPQIAQGLGTSVSSVSYSITLYSIVVAVASPVLSILLARISRTTLMAVGLAAIAAGTGATVLSHSIGAFEVGRVVAALGGAALVPAATAAASSLLPPEQRGRALAIAGLGFSLATAIGAPLGTALAGIGGWRLPLALLAALGAVLAVVIAVVVRGIPVGVVSGVRARLGVLRSGRMLATLVAAVLLTTAFNVVYIFSSPVTHRATGGSSTLLAILLLVYGVGGIIGTNVSGRLTDRLGSRLLVGVGLLGEAFVLAALPLVEGSYVVVAAVFLVWGVLAFAVVVPLQHRLVGLDPAAAGIALSWYSTAMYVGIALAPVLGAAVIGGGFGLTGPVGIPIVGAALALLACVAFFVGYLRRSAARASLAEA